MVKRPFYMQGFGFIITTETTNFPKRFFVGVPGQGRGEVVKKKGNRYHVPKVWFESFPSQKDHPPGE